MKNRAGSPKVDIRHDEESVAESLDGSARELCQRSPLDHAMLVGNGQRESRQSESLRERLQNRQVSVTACGAEERSCGRDLHHRCWSATETEMFDSEVTDLSVDDHPSIPPPNRITLRPDDGLGVEIHSLVRDALGVYEKASHIAGHDSLPSCREKRTRRRRNQRQTVDDRRGGLRNEKERQQE